MDFIYTEEFQEYYIVIFHVDDIPFSAMIDKQTKAVIDISTLTSGVYNKGHHPYNKDTSLKQIDWLPVNYFEVEEALVGYFNNEGTR